MQEKDNLRKKIKEYFKKYSLQERKQKNKTLIQNIVDFLETQNFENIALYIAMKDEVDLKELETKLLKKKKNIFYPEILGERNLIFKTKDGIKSDKIEIFIIPGRAFTKDGKRLGRGKGCYDQFFETTKNSLSLKIGVCFDFQIVENLPTEKHDILLDTIISNEL